MAEKIEGVEELSDAVVVGEVDPRAGREKVRDHEASDDFDDLHRGIVVDEFFGQRRDERGGHVDHSWKAVDGELTKNLAAFGGQQSRKMVVTCEFTTRHDDASRQEVVDVGCALGFGPQLFEEHFEFAHAHRLEEDFPPAGKQSIDRCARDTRSTDDVVDGDLCEAQLVD